MAENHASDRLTHQIGQLLQRVKQLYQEGRYGGGIAFATECRDLASRHFGQDHPTYAASLSALAGLHQAMGDHAASLSLCRQALDIFRVSVGENHPAYATSLASLASLHRDMGDHAVALPLHLQALEIYRTALGANHPYYATSLSYLGGSHVATGRASEAVPLLQQAAAIDDRMIGQILAIGSERQRMAFLDAVLRTLYRFLSLVLEHLGDSPDAVYAAFDLVLRRKGVAAEAAAMQRDALLGARIRVWNPGCANFPPCVCKSPARRSRVLALRDSSLTGKKLPPGRPRRKSWKRSWPARSPR